MHIIPVIDVRHGVAVRAVAGDRANYRPLDTPFAEGSDPLAVARGLAGAFEFKTLYVADLDGIEGRGPNLELLTQLTAALPEIEFWVDGAGINNPGVGIPSTLALPARGRERVEFGQLDAIPPPSWGRLEGRDFQRLPAGSGHVPVVGSESLGELDDYQRLSGLGPDPRRDDGEIASNVRHVLSLDFRGDQFVGPTELLARPELWPARVIVMTLARVGGTTGPDLARVREISAKAAGRAVYVAGGVRTMDDLRAAQQAGATGALIATALHAGMIKPADIRDAAGL